MTDSKPHSRRAEILTELGADPRVIADRVVELEERLARYEQMEKLRVWHSTEEAEAEFERLRGIEEQLEAAERERDEAHANTNEGLQWLRDDIEVKAETIRRLEEQLEAAHSKMTSLFAGYEAKCERWSLGTCDHNPDLNGKLCRICQFFTDLGYESFQVTTGGLRSWRPVKKLDESVLAAKDEQ